MRDVRGSLQKTRPTHTAVVPKTIQGELSGENRQLTPHHQLIETTLILPGNDPRADPQDNKECAHT